MGLAALTTMRTDRVRGLGRAPALFFGELQDNAMYHHRAYSFYSELFATFTLKVEPLGFNNEFDICYPGFAYQADDALNHERQIFHRSPN